MKWFLLAMALMLLQLVVIHNFLGGGGAVAPTVLGIEWDIAGNRHHWAVTADRVHWDVPSGRMHWEVPEE